MTLRRALLALLTATATAGSAVALASDDDPPAAPRAEGPVSVAQPVAPRSAGRPSQGTVALHAADPDRGRVFGLLTWTRPRPSGARRGEPERCYQQGLLRQLRTVRLAGPANCARLPLSEPLQVMNGSSSRPSEPSMVLGLAREDIVRLTVQGENLSSEVPISADRGFLIVVSQKFRGELVLSAELRDGTTTYQRFQLPAGLRARRPAAPPASPQAADSSFAVQRAVLSVLRDREARDDDPRVRREIRDWRQVEHVRGVRAQYARLLGVAPSGSGYVLVPTESYDDPGRPDPATGRVRSRRRPNGLCLVRQGTQGGAAQCYSTSDVLRGRARDQLAGFAYGLVPDGVHAVRPSPGDRPVRVKRNFYVFPWRWQERRNPAPDPEWLDAHGQVVRQDGSVLRAPARQAAKSLLDRYAVLRRPATPRDALPDSAPPVPIGLTTGAHLVTTTTDVNLDLARQIAAAHGARAWIVPGERDLCLVTAGPDGAGGVGCGPASSPGYLSGRKPIGSSMVGPMRWRPHRRLVLLVLPDGIDRVALERDGRILRRLAVRNNGLLVRPRGADHITWRTPDGRQARRRVG